MSDRQPRSNVAADSPRAVTHGEYTVIVEESTMQYIASTVGVPLAEMC
jgi:hypothetical protein